MKMSDMEIIVLCVTIYCLFAGYTGVALWLGIALLMS